MYRRFILQVSAVFCLAQLGYCAEHSEEKGESFSTQVWRIVRPEAKSPAADALSPLAELIAKQAKHPKEMPDAARKLAQPLSSVDPPPLWKELAEGIHVGDEYGATSPPAWKYGSPGDRLLLANYLWSQAQAKDLPIDDVKLLGNAALLLSSGEGCMLSGGAFDRMLSDMESNKISLLTEADLLRLKKVIARGKEQNAIYAKAHAQARTAIYRLAEETFPVGEDRVKAALQDLDGARAAAPDQFARFRVVDFAWKLLNLARKEQDERTLLLVTNYIKSWREKGEDAAVSRWLDEALKTDGPAPVIFRKLE